MPYRFGLPDLHVERQRPMLRRLHVWRVGVAAAVSLAAASVRRRPDVVGLWPRDVHLRLVGAE